MQTLTVKRLAEKLDDYFKKSEHLRAITIVGEVSEWKPWRNGNIYMTLKDPDGPEVLGCVIFANRSADIQPPTIGAKVAATGAVEINRRMGRYELQIRSIEPLGDGLLAARVEELRGRLKAEGLFEAARKRAIPDLPLRIAVVSAKGSEGVRDIEKALREKATFVGVDVCDTLLQGEAAPRRIAQALAKASQSEVDVVVLTRGGGSFADRMPFNSEAVARAIVGCRHPVVTAIGHADDHHVADDVADLALATPTAAANRFANAWESALKRLARAPATMQQSVLTVVNRASQSVDHVGEQLVNRMRSYVAGADGALRLRRERLDRASPARRIADGQARLASLAASLRGWPGAALATWQRAVERRSEALRYGGERAIGRAEQRVEHSGLHLAGVDPKKPLERGYAIVSRDGHALRDAREVTRNDRVAIRLFRGSLGALVEEVCDDA